MPVHLGLLGGARLVALADLLEPLGAEARITRQQNLLLANVPAADVDAVVAALAGLELPSSSAVFAATGSPAPESRTATTR